MRKLFLLFWALLATTHLWAHHFEVYGIYYNYLGDNNVAVTYDGTFFNKYSGEVTIPETVTYEGTTYSVTSIGTYAFDGCSSLTSITIPNSVTSIGTYAFDGCSSLSLVTLTAPSVEAFCNWQGNNLLRNAGCHASRKIAINGEIITSITIPNSVTSIEEGAFSYCSSLTSITIPNSVTSIGYIAFSGCSSLTSIKIEATTPPTLGSSVFAFCESLSTIYIPDNTLSAYQQVWGNEYPYYNNETILTLHVEVPGTLSDLIFDAGKRPINVIKLTLTGTLNDDDFTCMRETMTSLVDVDLSEITNTSGVNFKNKTKLMRIILPADLATIESGAFYACSSLTSVTIPNSVTSIGYIAFSGCSSLASITIPNSVMSIEEGAFSYCSSLTSITIPNSVTSIGDGAFFICSSLTSVTIGNSVTSIGVEAFAHCSSLTSVTIPNSVTSIGNGAFDECSSLTSVTIPNSVTSIGYIAFSGCSSLASMVVEEGNTTYDSRDNCNAIIETATNTLIVGCKNTTIPNSVTSIGGDAFYDCSALTSITIPNSVTSIGGNAFFGCSSLTSITIPNSVTSIGYSAFYYCTSLTSITISNSVTSIGDGAFYYCSSLKTVICKAVEVPALGSYVFSSMPLSEATLYVPAQSLDDYKAADQWKEFGTILPLEGTPSSVENIPSTTSNCQKIIRDGKLVIIRDGVEYNVMGQQL